MGIIIHEKPAWSSIKWTQQREKQTLIFMDIHRWNLIKSCLWDFKNSTCSSSQKHGLNSWEKTHQYHFWRFCDYKNCSLWNENSTCHPGYPPSSPVFLATKPKNHLFSKKHVEGSKELVCLIQQPAGAFTRATRGVDRLSSAVWEESRAAGSVSSSPRLGLWMQIKLLFLIKQLAEKQIRRLLCGATGLILHSG